MPGSLPRERDFRIRLFGGPLLEHKGHNVPISPFHGLLLAILAYHGRRGIRRDHLLSFLWPAGPEGALRRRLSQLQYSLHQRVRTPDLVINDGDRFFLDVDRVEPDLEQFHTALQERRLEEALELLFLEFLGEVNSTPTPELDSWIGERTRQFRADIRSAAARLWGEAEQRGDWEQATRTGRVLLVLDPLDEGSLRRLLRSLGLTGQAAEARAVFREFTERAAAGGERWAPEADTIVLVNRLDTLARERGPTFMLGRYGLSDTPPMVGREDELATLGRLLRDPTEASVISIGLVGEPGVGKTRLAWEALRTLPFDGVRVLSARCSEFERRIPLSPFTSALKPAWVAEEARSLANPWRAVLLSLFPEWHPGPGPPPPVPDIEPSEVPRRICEAFRQLFLALARTDPVVLFIDDFHWADETSLSVLDYIRSRGVEGDFRVLVALGDLAGKEISFPGFIPTSAGMRWLNADRTSLRIALTRLTSEQAIALARECLRISEQEVDPGEIVRLAGRNPLLLTEVINNWTIVRDTERNGLAGLPSSLHQVLIEPLASLAAPELRVLNLLSVSIQPIPAVTLVEHLERLLGTGGNSALEGLILRRMVELGEQGFQVLFRILALAVRQLMPVAERISLSRWFSEGLFGQAKEPAVLAHYARESQDFRIAATAFSEAAANAWQAGAALDAVHFLREALSCAHSPQDKQAAQVKLSEGLLRARMVREAIPSLHVSEALLAGADDVHGALRHRILRLSCELTHGGHANDRTRRDLWGAVDEAAQKGFDDLAVLALDALARFSHAISDSASLREILASASSLLTNDIRPEVAARIYLILSLRVYLDLPEAGLDAARRGIERSAGASCITLRVSALNRLLMLLGTHGLINSREGRETLAQLHRLGASSGDLRERCQPKINQGVWQLLCGDFHRSLESLMAATKEVSLIPDADLNARLHCNIGIVYLRLTDSDSALTHLGRAEDFLPPSAPDEGRVHILAGLGWAYVLAGRLSNAKAMLEAVEPYIDSPFVDPLVLAGFRARLESRLRRHEAADQIFRRAVEVTVNRLPMSGLDLTLQRTELLGLKLGLSGWEEQLDWAERFCEERDLQTKLRALRMARAMAEA